MGADLRQAIRMLRGAPGFAAIAILTLALAIGANTAIFSVVNGLLLRSLAVSEPQRLATISSDFAISRGFKAGLGWSRPMWDYLAERADAFGGAFVWSPERFNLVQGGGEVQPIDVLHASGGFFSTLGVTALRGRVFTTADDVPGGGPDGPVAVISYNTWQRRFAGEPSIVGAPLVLEGVRFTIVGVTPPDFTGIEVGRSFDAVIPLDTEPLLRKGNVSRFNNYLLIVMLRLKPGQSLESATAVMRAMQPHLPGFGKGPKFLQEPFALLPAAEGTSGYGGVGTGLRQAYERPLLTILVLVALVLLVACVNIANLLLGRATATRHDLSVRAALGASRWRLARQLLVESLVLAGIGALVGLPYAAWGSRALVSRLSTREAGVFLDLSLDWRVLAFTAGASILTAVLFGIAPAIRAARVPPIEAIKEKYAAAARSGVRRLAGVTVSDGLVIAQIALSLVLVVTAGLLVTTFARLANTPLGFDSDRILIADVDTARAHTDDATRREFNHRLVDAVAAVPGVADAAGSDRTPLSKTTKSPILSEPGRVVGYTVTPGFFATYGTSIRAGRALDSTDTAQSQPTVIVSEAYVRRFFPDRSALGQLVDKRTVVGVASDAVFGSVRAGVRPMTYVPMRQAEFGPPGRSTFSISIRSASGRPAALAPAVGAALTSVHPGVTFAFRPLSDDVDETLMAERLVAMLSGVFAGLTLLLAGLGLYGVTSYAVARRRREIGIRMALGAERADVLALVLERCALMTATGLAIGLAAATLVTRYLGTLLFGVSPLHPATFATVSLIFVAVSLLASFIPARRATRVDPLVVIRRE
jgi:predicted permease